MTANGIRKLAAIDVRTALRYKGSQHPGLSSTACRAKSRGVAKDSTHVVSVPHLLQDDDRLSCAEPTQQRCEGLRLWSVREAEAPLMEIVATDLLDQRSACHIDRGVVGVETVGVCQRPERGRRDEQRPYSKTRVGDEPADRQAALCHEGATLAEPHGVWNVSEIGDARIVERLDADGFHDEVIVPSATTCYTKGPLVQRSVRPQHGARRENTESI